MTTPNTTVLVMPPYTSPPFRAEDRVVEEPCSRLPEDPGQRNAWWRNRGFDVTFSRMPASQVPAEVDRCSVCGGGR